MWGRVIGGLGLCLLGGVWFGQGIGKIHGSFMTSQSEWTVIGALAVIIGLALLTSAVLTRANRRS